MRSTCTRSSSRSRSRDCCARCPSASGTRSATPTPSASSMPTGRRISRSCCPRPTSRAPRWRPTRSGARSPHTISRRQEPGGASPSAAAPQRSPFRLGTTTRPASSATSANTRATFCGRPTRRSTRGARPGPTEPRSAHTAAKTRHSLVVRSRLYLIRHADVENPNKVLYGHLDGFQLSALGRAQAAALGDRLQSEDLSRIVSSPLDRAVETARLINERLARPALLESDPELREAEFSRYLQGLPYWQVPLRRPLWFVHKARRGLVPGDESIDKLGGRVLSVVRRMAREHPGETMAVVSHADPLNAAWIVLDGRPHNEREMYRKTIDKAGMLSLEMEGETPVSWEYVPPPVVAKPASAAA